jgi:hypothetical protein
MVNRECPGCRYLFATVPDAAEPWCPDLRRPRHKEPRPASRSHVDGAEAPALDAHARRSAAPPTAVADQILDMIYETRSRSSASMMRLFLCPRSK